MAGDRCATSLFERHDSESGLRECRDGARGTADRYRRRPVQDYEGNFISVQMFIDIDVVFG